MMTAKYCPRSEIKKLEIEIWNLKVKGTDVVSYTQHFQELALMCGRMFLEESDEVEKYVGGLPDMIQGSVMASKPKKMQDAIYNNPQNFPYSHQGIQKGLVSPIILSRPEPDAHLQWVNVSSVMQSVESAARDVRAQDGQLMLVAVVSVVSFVSYHKMSPKRTTTPMSDNAIKALVARSMADALAENEANRNSRNGDHSHEPGSG
ncbi:hypothetical protein Tco_1200501 [Tanacetum coccineum]